MESLLRTILKLANDGYQILALVATKNVDDKNDELSFIGRPGMTQEEAKELLTELLKGCQ